MPATLTLATLDGQPTAQHQVPTSWAEVSLAQYLAAHDGSSPHAPAVRLSGLPAAVLDTLTAESCTELSQHLAAVLPPAVLEALLPTPSLLEIGRSAYALHQCAAKHLATLPAGAHPLVFGAYLYALYRQPTGWQPDPDEVAAAHAAVLASPLPDVYADCQYFLASWARMGQPEAYTGAEQPGVLRIAHTAPPAPAPSLLSRLAQRLPSLPGTRRSPRAGLIA